jgi:hypothetical protein
MFPTRLPRESNAHPSHSDYAVERAMWQEELLGLQWEEVDFERGGPYVIKFAVV